MSDEAEQDLNKWIHDLNEKKKKAGQLFDPRTPIDTTELFSGRYSQIAKIGEAINQDGAHVIIYGERGAGKTSIANVAPISYHVHHAVPLAQIVAPRVNCDGTDTFDSIWRKTFQKITVTSPSCPIGFLQHTTEETTPYLESIPDCEFTPGVVQQVLSDLGNHCKLIATFDEFDRLSGSAAPRLMADTIKALSDNRVQATIVMVGVGDSVAELVRGHESVGRHLVEVPIPRMSRAELEKIMSDRLPKLQMTIERQALEFLTLISAGLPYFIHLLGLHAVLNTIECGNAQISKINIDSAMKRAIEDSEREMKTAYYAATTSRHPRSQFTLTLAACALATHDDFGFFTAANVREQLCKIRGVKLDIPAFVAHLDRFCSDEYGSILRVSGSKHQRRYRFRDPLMQPFVIIRSLDDKLITPSHINPSVT